MTAREDTPAEQLDATDEELAEVLLAVLEDVATIEAAAVEQLLRKPDPDAYLAWARDALPTLAPALFEAHDEPNDKIACWLARRLWDVMPVETNGFEPVPMPRPEPEATCPCGSGRTFKACSDFTIDMPILADSLWPALAESKPPSHWLRLARNGALPDEALMYIAEWFAEAGHWQQNLDLLLPKVRAGSLSTDHSLHAMDKLCQSYRELERPKDEGALLRRFASHDDAPVRCTANRRLATILHEEGHRDRAWRHFEAAAADSTADDPATGLQELVLLTTEGRMGDAEDRAAYWLAHLTGEGVEHDDPMLQLIQGFEDDAQYGRDEYFRWILPLDLRELVDAIEDAVERRLSTPAWRRMRGTGDDELLRDAHVPAPSSRIGKLERQWFELGRDGPFEPDADDMPDLAARVLWLRAHPEASDSFEILADLAELLETLEFALGGRQNRWYGAVLQRGADMVERGWPDDRAGTVPWVVGDNRPALSLLADYIELLDERDDGFEDLMTLYLRLNPNDNHGCRTDLIDLLLRGGRNDEALELGERYPTDMFASTRYGRALALYRLGRMDEATEAIGAAVVDLPLVLKHLLRNQIKQPAPDEYGMVIGGEYQAWLYRDAMRDTWMAEPGVKDWLKQFVPKAQRSLRDKKKQRRH